MGSNVAGAASGFEDPQPMTTERATRRVGRCLLRGRAMEVGTRGSSEGKIALLAAQRLQPR